MLKTKLLKNLHHVFLIFGILFGFYLFAYFAKVDVFAATIIYLVFYLPAFFAGLFSGRNRSFDSSNLDRWSETVESIFKIKLENYILARGIIFFYFTFWLILFFVNGCALELLAILPAYLFGLFANEDFLLKIKGIIIRNW